MAGLTFGISLQGKTYKSFWCREKIPIFCYRGWNFKYFFTEKNTINFNSRGWNFKFSCPPCPLCLHCPPFPPCPPCPVSTMSTLSTLSTLQEKIQNVLQHRMKFKIFLPQGIIKNFMLRVSNWKKNCGGKIKIFCDRGWN